MSFEGTLRKRIAEPRCDNSASQRGYTYRRGSCCFTPVKRVAFYLARERFIQSDEVGMMYPGKDVFVHSKVDICLAD